MDDKLLTVTVRVEYHVFCPHCLHHHSDDDPLESPFECECCGREFLLESES